MANFINLYLDFLERTGKVLGHFFHCAAATASRRIPAQAARYSDCEMVASLGQLLSENYHSH